MNPNLYFDQFGNVIKPLSLRRILACALAITGIIVGIRYIYYLFFMKNEEHIPPSQSSSSNENEGNEPKIKY